MKNLEKVFSFWRESLPVSFLEKVQTQTLSIVNDPNHGDWERWTNALQCLPDKDFNIAPLNQDTITVGNKSDLTEEEHEILCASLREFIPWRKGPFNICGHVIDTEWRSDWKWQRIQDKISNLKGRKILDVGCGSGYHCWRMLGAGADVVMGIDPTRLFFMQYLALQHFIQTSKMAVLPLGIDHLPDEEAVFDMVFSMGVLYHRKDPLEHLRKIKSLLNDGGELILETLIIESDDEEVLVPEDRYAKMRNVWNIPSCKTVETWLAQEDYQSIRCVDINKTTTEEQRQTDWMQFESLAQYLDPTDPHKTIEGYPAPVRAVFIAQKSV